MRQIGDRVRVQVGRGGDPERLWWAGEGHRVVRVTDRWRYGGRWWRGESARDYFLVETARDRTFVLYREETTEAWTLALQSD